jgi:hypothetical protein
MLFGLLTAVPMFVMQWHFPRVPIPDFLSGETMPTVTLPPICWIMFLLVILLWPISTAGFQYVADDVLRGRRRSLLAQFSAAVERYGRMLGAFMVYMNARLFINFLFWEQTAAFGDGSPLLALRESRDLARCAPELPRVERPLYRGPIVASIWVLFLLFAVIAIQVPFTFLRLRGVDNPEQALAVMQSLSQAKTPDALMIVSDIASAVMNLVLRPLLAASFIVLYYDAKARRGR